uniref:Tripartite motif-containing protein 16 n=1 Tax=Fundulus heteroclitus TaxID=8078 RepID=A0A147AL44_FUNHE
MARPEDLHCPVCIEMFRDPVILPCSHSFCKTCLQYWWEEKKAKECPLCKNISVEREGLCNLVLKNLCENLSEERIQNSRQDICSLHGEKLKLFCLDHQEPVCVVCRDSEIHNSHRFRPVDEAARQHRTELQDTMKTLQEKMKVFNQAKVQFSQTAEYIKAQGRHTERQIKLQFQKLHQFLEEEEEARLAALQKEETQKSQMVKERIDTLRREMMALLDTMRATEEELRASDVSLLLNLRSTMERVPLCPLLEDPQLPSGVLLDVAKHLGNLGFNIWKNMKDTVSFTPIVLDPNTANPELILSEDLTTVRCGRKLQFPENPERIKAFCAVLGSQGFTSGAHSWEVEVENQTRWELGVLQGSVQRKGDLCSGLWRIQLWDDKHCAISPPQSSSLLAVKKLQKIRVDLDLDRKKLAFYDADTDTHIHTFTHNFTHTVFPYIWTAAERPLRILPAKINGLCVCWSDAAEGLQDAAAAGQQQGEERHRSGRQAEARGHQPGLVQRR